MTEPTSGFEIASAYVKVTTQIDQSSADAAAEKIKTEVEAGVKANPVQVPVTAENPIDAAWREKVDAAVKAMGADALKIPMTPETEQYRADLRVQLDELQHTLDARIPASLADSDRFKAEAEALAQEVSHTIRAHIPVDVKVDQAAVDKTFVDMNTRVGQGTQQATQQAQGMGNSMALVWTGLGALLGGPLIGAALGAAGAGFTALGVVAEHGTQQVTSAWHDMTSTMKTELAGAFSTMTPAIAGGIANLEQGFRSIGPDLASISSEVAPALATVSLGITDAAQNLAGGFNVAMQNSVPIAQGFRTAIDATSQGLADMVSHLDFQAGAQGLVALGNDFKALLPVVGQLFNTIAPLGNALLSDVIPPVVSLAGHLLTDLAPAINLVSSLLNLLNPVLNAFGPALGVGAAALLAFKPVTNLVLTGFNALSGGITTVGNKIASLAGGSNQAVGSLSVMTDAMKKQEVQSTASALAAAKQQAAQDAQSLATLKAAAAADAASVSAKDMATAEGIAAASAATATDAETAFAVASRAVSFAAGPVGLALGAVAAVMTLFGDNASKATQPTQDLTADLQRLAYAAPASAQGIVAQSPALQALIPKLSTAGTTVKALTDAYAGGAGTLKTYTSGLQDQNTKLGATSIGLRQAGDGYTQASGNAAQTFQTVKQLSDAVDNQNLSLSQLPPNIQAMVREYQAQNTVIGQLNTSLPELTQQQQSAAAVTQANAVNQQQATGIASALGISVNTVTNAFQDYASGVTYAIPQSQAMSETFLTQTLAVDQAKNTLANYFTNANQQLVQAQQSVSSAAHSYTQAVQSIADAQHAAGDAAFALTQAQQGVATALQGVKTAQQGVVTAGQSYTNAVIAETNAQTALNNAQAQAIQNMENLQLQYNDNVASQESANAALFDAQTTAAANGVTTANAHQIAAEQVTATNEVQVRAAIALVQAENAVADAGNTTTQTQTSLNTALQQGVQGNPAVIAAQQALVNAQNQVTAAAQAEVTAQQAVVTAEQGVTNANHALQDAQYNNAKAAQAVTDALYNQRVAAQQVATAQQGLKVAQDNASQSLDAGTQAGQRNIGMLQTLANTLYTNETVQQAGNDLVQATANAFNMSTTAATNYLKQINLIPQSFKFSVTAVGQVDLSAVAQLEQQVPGMSGTNLLLKADGGPVSGPGGPREDRIPAMLSDGEYVVNADAARKSFSLLEALNNNKFAAGGFVTANGTGLAAANLLYGKAGIDYQDISNTYKIMGLPGPPSLAAYIAPNITNTKSATGGMPAVPQSRAANEAAVQSVFSQFGWGSGAEWAAAVQLIMMESGFNNVAQNPTSSAYGIFQFLNSTWGGYGIGKTSDPTQQALGGARYIQSRYGDPIGALAHEYAFHWYDQGGYALPGQTRVANATGRPEMVLPPGMTQTMERLNAAVSGGATPMGSTTHNWNITVNGADDPMTVARKVVSEVQWHMMTVGG